MTTDFVAALIPLAAGAALGTHVLTAKQVATVRRFIRNHYRKGNHR